MRRSFGVHGRLYKAILGLVPDLLTLRPGVARVSKSPPFMDLHLDVLQVESERGHRWLRFSLAHYQEQNGDLVADPDMEARISLDSSWPVAEALNYTQAGLGVYQEVYPSPGMVNPRVKRDLNAFLETWLRNARQQGHRLAGVAS